MELAVACGRPLLLRQPFEPDAFDEVILGCASPLAEEVNPGRVAAMRLGCGNRMPGWTVQRNCGSGMQAVETAFRYIADGRAELVLAGGAESLSHTPLIVNAVMTNWLADWYGAGSFVQRLKLLGRLRARHFKPVIGLLKGLTDPVVELNMGQTAEVLAHRFGIGREAMDAYALESHRRLAKAREEHRMGEIEVAYDRKGQYYDRDDGVRADNTMERLGRLKPAFEPPYGNVTAGNSSQITDGAAWLILASDAAVKRWQLEPLGRIVDSQWAALDPAVMGLGPVHSSAPLLRRHKLGLDTIDVWEINEAFAAQVLACLEAFADRTYCRDVLGLDKAIGAIDRTRLNVDGGAISLGHPVGASGARIALHLLHALRQRKGKRGIATLCIGGGQGGALLMQAA